MAIYKNKQPDALSALKDALKVLQVLKPETCNNPETLGRCGAIHKRLWEIDPAPELLDTGITAFARAFALKLGHYSGSGCPRRLATNTSGYWPRCGKRRWARATRWRWSATKPGCAPWMPPTGCRKPGSDRARSCAHCSRNMRR
jgi:hypothetical protein